ncbi:hormogonium tapered terminus morphoprotein TftA [Almyronema epifaneia]|uniref:N-acetylmuramoyl-L-alanine amidase n=1 Tax=Almyronema epifaneia S1 TaxID=2991925 RepID=A0ABW6IDQ8_9CYAN
MGKIFVSAGHGGLEGGVFDPGVVLGATNEAKEMIQIRDLVVPELRSRGFTTLSVPDDLSAAQSIAWINARYSAEDVALEIHASNSPDSVARGATVFYIANNETRRNQAELLLLALLRRVPQLPSRGAKPDTASALGSLAFCRQIVGPSLLMEIAFLTNSEDLNLLQNRRREIALGIADGLAAWSRAVSGNATPIEGPVVYPEVNISINGGLYGEKGIIINDNAFIPIDVVDQLGVDLASDPNVRRVRYGNVVYVKAVDLRNFNISVGWEAATRTLLLRSLVTLKICPGLIDSIMGHGNTSEVQLMMFLKGNNERALDTFADLPKLYREEATIEGVNYDIAFCQMCVETEFLRFTGNLSATSNNFGGLGAAGGEPSGASFTSARLGVRAQIQHLKAYASIEPLVQELVDPRFRFVPRGIAPLVQQLSGRWAADVNYGDKILALLRRLYETAGFF